MVRVDLVFKIGGILVVVLGIVGIVVTLADWVQKREAEKISRQYHNVVKLLKKRP